MALVGLRLVANSRNLQQHCMHQLYRLLVKAFLTLVPMSSQIIRSHISSCRSGTTALHLSKLSCFICQAISWPPTFVAQHLATLSHLVMKFYDFPPNRRDVCLCVWSTWLRVFQWHFLLSRWLTRYTPPPHDFSSFCGFCDLIYMFILQLFSSISVVPAGKLLVWLA